MLKNLSLINSKRILCIRRRGYGLMAEREISNLSVGVRFSLPAPNFPLDKIISRRIIMLDPVRVFFN